MNKSIFITGSTGFIGSNILDTLSEYNFNIIRGVRKSNLGENEIYCDLSIPESILEIKKKIKADIIIHFGAKIGWGLESHEDLYTPNVLGTACVASLAKEWGAKLIFASAALIHGVKSTKIDQNSDINLDNYYASTKWTGEKIILSSEIDYCILRIGGVFGKNGPLHLGINKSIKNAINGIKPNLNGQGTGKRNYIYVKDLARFVIDIIENNYNGIHYVSSTYENTIKEMLIQISQVFLSDNEIKIEGNVLSTDQLITPSKDLKSYYNFRESLIEIKELSNK